MNFSIVPDILQSYPSFRVVIVTAKGVRVSEYDRDIDALLEQQEYEVNKTLSLPGLPDHPHIAAWRKTYASFGSKPSKYRCAAESLLRAVLKKGSLPKINSLVDLCNYVAIKHCLPIDAMDLVNIVGDIYIRYAKGDEYFLPLGAHEPDNPDAGEVIYCDDVEVLGRRWNWRKCDKNKVTQQTKNILCTVEGIGNIESDRIKQAADELQSLLKSSFNCTPQAYWFDTHMNQAQVL